MQIILNIKKVSLLFFIITGLLHLGSGAFIANGLLLKEMGILNKSMDIPFILSGLLYSFSCLRLGLTNPQKEHKKLDISLLIIIILLLILTVALNIFFPDLPNL